MATMAPVGSAVSIPVIDISPLYLTGASDAKAESCEAVSKVIAEVSEAARSHGLFAVTGHGIPADIIASAFAATRESLEHDGPAEREDWAGLESVTSSRLAGELKNFSPAGEENVGRVTGKLGAPAERVAKFTVFPPSWDEDDTVPDRQRNVWPATDSGRTMKQALELYYMHAQRVSDALHGALSQALGKPQGFIKEMLEPYTQGALRALRYQHEEGRDLDRPAPALAAHKDLGTTTLLTSDAPGLQFQPRGSEEWVDVAVPQGALVVNLGEFFEVWTGGAWHATMHRVAASGRQGRTSLAFFANQSIRLPIGGGPPPSRVVEPLGSSRSEWQGLKTHEASEARSSLQWPAFFFDRLAALTGKPSKEAAEQEQLVRPAQGGA